MQVCSKKWIPKYPNSLLLFVTLFNLSACACVGDVQHRVPTYHQETQKKKWVLKNPSWELLHKTLSSLLVQARGQAGGGARCARALAQGHVWTPVHTCMRVRAERMDKCCRHSRGQGLLGELGSWCWAVGSTCHEVMK